MRTVQSPNTLIYGVQSLDRRLQPLEGSKQTHKNYTLEQFANEFSKQLGLSRASILSYLSLVSLTPELKGMVSEGELPRTLI